MMALAGAFLHQGKRICLKDGCYRSLSRILEIPSSRSSSVGAAMVADWVVPLKLRFLEANEDITRGLTRGSKLRFNEDKPRALTFNKRYNV